jgi:hypothetical protein
MLGLGHLGGSDSGYGFVSFSAPEDHVFGEVGRHVVVGGFKHEFTSLGIFGITHNYAKKLMGNG